MLSFILFVATQVVTQFGSVAPSPRICTYPQTSPTSYGDHTVFVPATGRCETYNIVGPPGLPGPRPLLVLFHHYSGNHSGFNDPVWAGYDLRTEAVARGWYVVMHDGGDSVCAPGYHVTYGNENFQRHTEAVLADVLGHFPIERKKIYGYGFSMGGQQALSYAARHRDPDSNFGFFAAVVNHSAYFPIYQKISATQGACGGFGDCPFGTSYCNDPFVWRRADLFDLTPLVCSPTGIVGWDPAYMWPPRVRDVSFWSSQIHNLAHTPLRTYHAAGEHSPNCMIPGNDLWQNFLRAKYPPASLDLSEVTNCQQPPAACGSATPDCSGDAHHWSAVCADDALDWLSLKDRDTVMAAVTGQSGFALVAQDDVVHYFFKVDRANDADFGRVHWFYLHPNAIGFLAPNASLFPGVVHNLSRITILADTVWSPINVTQYVEIQTNYAVVNQIRGYATQPTIFRDNDTTPLTEGVDWFYYPATDTVEFTSDGTQHLWKITP